MDAVSDSGVIPVDADVDDLSVARHARFQKDDEDSESRKLTGKQKRKADRRERLKNKGADKFYDTVDVKNRTRKAGAQAKMAKSEVKRTKHQKRVWNDAFSIFFLAIFVYENWKK